MGRKGRYSAAAAREFEAELESSVGDWHVRRNENDEPVIPGRRGELYPFGPGQLGVWVYGETGRTVAAIKTANPDWEPYQEGDTEANFLVPIEELDRAVKAIKAYRRVLAARTVEARRLSVRKARRSVGVATCNGRSTDRSTLAITPPSLEQLRDGTPSNGDEAPAVHSGGRKRVER